MRVQSRRVRLRDTPPSSSGHTPRNSAGMSAMELTFIGVGGIIGAGFFLGSGLPIHLAGPSVLLAFLLGAAVTGHVLGALASMAVDDPQPGSFVDHARRYMGPYAGFLQGWVFYIASVMTVASEAVAMAIFTRLWVSSIPVWAIAGTYALAIIAINALGVKNFGRIESWMSMIKLAALVGFIAVSIALVARVMGRPLGTPVSPAAHWQPFFPHGIHGTLESMLIVIFAYGGIGVFATAATKARSKSAVDRGAMATIGLLVVLYMASIACVLLRTPYAAVSTTISPFVEALHAEGLPLLAEILNAVILVAAFSVMTGSVFAANQILVNLAEHRDAPHVVARRTRRNTPMWALMVTALCIAITLVLAFLVPSGVYDVLISACSFLSFLNWFLILWTFLRWRAAKRATSVHLSRLALGAPIVTVAVMTVIVVLSGYALSEPAQRLGCYGLVGIVIAVSVCYVLTRKNRNQMHHPQEANGFVELRGPEGNRHQGRDPL